jgi:AraC-like DNA-binding protein
VMKYRTDIKQALSSLERQQLSWLVLVLSGFFAKWFFDAWFVFDLSFRGIFSRELLLLSRLVLFLFINLLVYKAMKQPQLFTRIAVRKGPLKPSLSESVAGIYEKQLLEYMELEKPYLNPDLTLVELSERVSIPPRSLSEVINSRLGRNFYDFINSYRVSESQRLLSSASQDRKTVLEVLYEVGFNSKSVFNDSFKKMVGMTPSEFKKRQIAA